MTATADERSVLLIGGTSEIGLAIVRRLATEGQVRPFLLGRDAEGLARVVASLEREGGPRVEHDVLEAGDLASHENTIARAFARAGEFDVVVLAIGVLVVASSVGAERPRASNAIYGAAKAGLDALALGLADGLAGSGVRVVVVRPGVIKTRMTAGLRPAPLATTPNAVAAATSAALRQGNHTVWVPGPLRYVFAVLRHLPRTVYRRLSF